MSDVCLAYLGDRKLEILILRKDFGGVVCGREHTEIFDLENDRNVCVCFSVIDEDPDGDGFTIHPKRVQVLPGKTARFKVTFVSYTPGIVYEKKYFVSDGQEIVAEFSSRCTSLGPEIRPKDITVKFFLTRNAKIQAKRFELENVSKCPVKFHFERPGNNRPFQIVQESGEIHGEGKVIVDVKFAPNQLGVYCKRVHCLFQYHPPVAITFIGVYNPGLKIDVNKLNFRRSTEVEMADSYGAFMRNLNEDYITDDVDPCLELVTARKAVVKFAQDEEDQDDSSEADAERSSKGEETRDDIHKAVLSLYYLNMGNDSSLTDGIRLINTSNSKEFYFEWSNENGKHFAVTPKSGNLKESQKLDLNVRFSPALPDRLYNGEVYVRIFPVNNDSEDVTPGLVTLPTTLHLSIIGHSFPDDSAGWLEQCKIEPDHLVLPACIPGEVVYSTLLMKRSGHLPVIFEFIPPKRTRMKIKPPLGYISDSYQLFVVQFDAPTGWEGTYTESWEVAYNSTTKYYDRVPISSQVENPKLIFGDNNSFEFDTTLPGGVSKSSVPITNPTRLKLLYEFVIPKYVTWIEIPVQTGELEPLSSAYIDVVFKPTETKEYLDYISCWTRSAKRQDYKVSTRIELQGSCQDGFLVAIPAFHDFGKCLLGKELKKKFKVFNFTPVLMHFQLSAGSDVFTEDIAKNLAMVEPERGSIPGKTDIEIKVTITPKVAVSSKIFIRCHLLPSNEEDSAPFNDPRTLITLRLEGILPTFQIIDLNVEGGGPLISPDWIWKMMDIKRINKALRTILPGQELALHVKLPDSAVGPSTMTIYMLIEAGCDCGVSLHIRNTYRKHFARKLTLTLLQADGLNEITISPSAVNLEPRCREVVKIEMRYDAVGSTIYEWSLNLSLNRNIIIRSVLNGFPDDETAQISTVLEPEVELKPVFIGDLNPPVQLFWLYNNTPNETSYVLDKAFLREASYPFPRIFNCLNGSGILPPYSSHPLMLKFSPNELRKYEVKTHLCLKTDYFEDLTITGSGVLNFSPISEFSHEETIPEISLLKQCKIAVEPSVKVFTIKPFPTFSSVDRIFSLENVSQDKVWAFQWHSFNVEGLIRAAVEPSQGQIKPGEKIIAKLTVTSFSQPTNICFSVPCDVIDYTALQSYEKAARMKEIVEEKCQDYFTITEKGITREIPEVALPEKPFKSHVFVAVRTNIIADGSIEAKLYPKDVRQMKYGVEVRDFCFDGSTLDEDITRLLHEAVERVVWNILNSPNFSRRLDEYNERCGRATYSQLFPGSEKEMKKIEKRSLSSLPKNLMQSVVENTIIDILSKNFFH